MKTIIPLVPMASDSIAHSGSRNNCYLLPLKTSRVTWQANMDPDLDDECQVVHEFSVVKCCFCYSSIFELKYMT